MPITTRLRLSAMMFIEFFIWGAWYVTMGTYLNNLGFLGTEIGTAYSSTAWGAIFAPFFIGMIADRFFPAQLVLGVLHILGAVLLYSASLATTPSTFFPILLAYTLSYMPTLALVNAISFHQMRDTQAEFPSIRVLGTIGWIVAGLIVGGLQIEHTATPMKLAAAASLLMGLYSFTLPHTPPGGKGKRVTIREILNLDALALMKNRSFAIFVISSLLLCIPLTFYYNFTNMFLNEIGVEYAASKMTLGQMSEIFFLLVMPFFFRLLGVKYMLLVGMVSWTLRYVFFSFGNADNLMLLLYLGILLHGVCFDFFFVTGQIYVDKVAPETIKASAQGFIALVTYGAGMLIGSFLSGAIVGAYAILDESGKAVGHAWHTIWLIPAGMALLILVLFALLFKEPNNLSTHERQA